MIVANPVDVLTYAAPQISGYPVERVFGSGTVLDTARLKYQVGRHLDVEFDMNVITTGGEADGVCRRVPD